MGFPFWVCGVVNKIILKQSQEKTSEQFYHGSGEQPGGQAGKHARCQDGKQKSQFHAFELGFEEGAGAAMRLASRCMAEREKTQTTPECMLRLSSQCLQVQKKAGGEGVERSTC